MKTSLRQRIDRDIATVDAQIERSRQAVRRPPDVPLSPLWMTQKMGYKPVIHCSCQSSIDLNAAKRKDVQSWLEEHQHCTPRGVTS